MEARSNLLLYRPLAQFHLGRRTGKALARPSRRHLNSTWSLSHLPLWSNPRRKTHNRDNKHSRERTPRPLLPCIMRVQTTSRVYTQLWWGTGDRHPALRQMRTSWLNLSRHCPWEWQFQFIRVVLSSTMSLSLKCRLRERSQSLIRRRNLVLKSNNIKLNRKVSEKRSSQSITPQSIESLTNS